MAETAEASRPRPTDDAIVDVGDDWALAGVTDALPPDRVALRAQAKRDKVAAKELLEPVAPSISRAAILVAISGVAAVVPFILIVEVCRELLRDPVDTGVITTLLIAAFVVLAFRGLLQVVGLVWTHRIDAGFQLSLRRRLAAKAGRLPLGWFTDRSSADVKRLLSDDVEALHYLIAHVRLEVVNATVTPLVILVYLFVADWRLALVTLIPLVAYGFALSAMMSPANTLLLGEFTRGQQGVERTAVEFVDGISVVRVFGRTRKAYGAYAGAVNRYADALAAWKLPMTKLQSAADILLAPVFLTLVVTAAAVGMAALDWIDPVDLVPFLLVGVGLGASVVGLGYGFQSLREGAAAARRIRELETTPELPDAVAATADVSRDDKPAGRVRFEGVAFGYDPKRTVVSGVDVELEPGTVTALVGPSGSGKTTLARLLARFHDVTDGAITIDGHDIRSMSLRDLYQTVGFVFQDVQLIRGTVADNLRLARPDATVADLEHAIRVAQIHDRIAELPRGLDSEIGVDVTFSGGEAQRLSIARTLLADSRVLVLDEATAFADPESEAAVQDALASVIADRTVLVIAHRLHTITEVDQILVLSDGAIVERGTHDQLVAGDGLYRRLWQSNEDALAILADSGEGVDR
ncbi:ABC transporter ATP-binding protein [Gordonia soli]|uniref:Putative ABC transporter permease/ATP-binding protein n=1 Tax=Gordonia soli NBRC 108243 TaxID=1223545 RepID=M0QQV9_9ACTN|nr:ABC transporter ATP-binding protein [Gordonia soli]GAC70656.1 putative ABC transporter permease/ATP-binding protein [Gordonia soli NBRC 108243]